MKTLAHLNTARVPSLQYHISAHTNHRAVRETESVKTKQVNRMQIRWLNPSSQNLAVPLSEQSQEIYCEP